jgi:asparagine synthase (glutamine-hydrolysing)
MSAIFGIIHTQGAEADRACLEAMHQALQHRGPDGSGIYQCGAVGLGHLLLSVTPESQYEQSPCHIAGLVISAQARLDERSVLMDRLRIPTELREQTTDPVLIGLSYRHWGERCVEYLLGDFAFAIWDEKEQKLFCAKDHLGIRPLLYTYQQGVFVFATELRAIVKCPLVRTQIDHAHILDLVVNLYDEPEKTGWTHIKLLRGGHTLVLQNQELRIRRYWAPQPQSSLWYKDPTEYGLHLRQILEQSIADRLRTNYPTGLTLSGGLDSSSIACIAAAQLHKQGRFLYTASSVLSPNWPYPDEDEKVYIQSVLDQEPNIQPSFVYSGEHHFLKGLSQKFDQHLTLVDFWHYVDTALYQHLQNKGVRRELSGHWGDLTVSLYDIYPLVYLWKERQFVRFWRLFQQIKQNRGTKTTTLLKSDFLQPLLPFKAWNLWQRFRQRPYPWSIDELPLELSAVERHTLLQRIEHYQQNLWHITSNSLFDNIVNEKFEFNAIELDCSAAHAQLETTYPFLDKRIIDFLFQLPVEAFFENGLPRGLIRCATKVCLPPLINQRKTKGYYSPGFPEIVKKDVPEMINWINNIPTDTEYIKFINLNKTKNILTRLQKSSEWASFVPDYFSMLRICMWIVLSHQESITANYKLKNIP